MNTAPAYGYGTPGSDRFVTAASNGLKLFTTLMIMGTGSMYTSYSAAQWRDMLQYRVPVELHVHAKEDEALSSQIDARSAAEHIANIREHLGSSVSDLANVLGVTRQAIYKWIAGDATPEADKQQRIQALSHVADKFAAYGVERAGSLMKMKAFEGQSLLDLAKIGKITNAKVDRLINESMAMKKAYAESAIANSKTAPADDWKSDISVPGPIESI